MITRQTFAVLQADDMEAILNTKAGTPSMECPPLDFALPREAQFCLALGKQDLLLFPQIASSKKRASQPDLCVIATVI